MARAFQSLIVRDVWRHQLCILCYVRLSSPSAVQSICSYHLNVHLPSGLCEVVAYTSIIEESYPGSLFSDACKSGIYFHHFGIILWSRPTGLKSLVKLLFPILQSYGFFPATIRRLFNITKHKLNYELWTLFGCTKKIQMQIILFQLCQSSFNTSYRKKSSSCETEHRIDKLLECGKEADHVKAKKISVNFRKQSGTHTPVCIDSAEVEMAESFRGVPSSEE